MSKKSRRRNRRLLALAALAGGAALAGRGKGTAGVNIDKGRGSELGTKYRGPHLDTVPEKNWITKKVVKPDTTITRTSGIKLSPSGHQIGAGGVDASGLSRGDRAQAIQAAANAPKNIYPPGMIPMHAAGTGHPLAKGRLFRKKGGSVKKAKVTGIAKRGFGRALMKGKK